MGPEMLIRDSVKVHKNMHKFQGSSGFYTWPYRIVLLYTSDAADKEDSVDIGGLLIIKKTIHSS